MEIYINGFKASRNDIAILFDRCKRGLDAIKEMHTTKRGNLAIVTV